MRAPRFSEQRRGEGGSVIILILVVLAALGAGWYFLRNSRVQREKEGRAFADQLAQHIVLQQDLRFLERAYSPEARLHYPPSFSMRLADNIRAPGQPNPQYKMKGQVTFTDQFFDASGDFIAEFAYPTGPAFLEVQVSHPGALWQVDAVNWTWTPQPTPTPSVTPAPSPTPTPSPTPSPAKKRHR
ncbi:MAG: hypothetical protein M3R10_00240 [Verrucomicrobiota bacterium]|nr:hypothetical protein [Verrucomicrobiota bacterium]